MSSPQLTQPECTVPLVELKIAGELDLGRIRTTGQTLDAILSVFPEHVVIDLSACRHIDAAAIGLLLDVHRRLIRQQALLTLRSPDPRVRRILQVAQLDHVLDIVPRQDTDAAGSAAAERPRASGTWPTGGPPARGVAKAMGQH